MATEDFNRLRMIAHRLVQTPFHHQWEFKLEIAGMPKVLSQEVQGVSTFDLLVKDISYGPTTIETEAIKAGGVTLTFPTGVEPVTLTMTMRDLSPNRPFYKAFQAWCREVYNEDGTFNLPTQYLRKVSRIALNDPGDVETWYMFPTKLGDITESVEAEGFSEIPVTMIQFRSVG